MGLFDAFRREGPTATAVRIERRRNALKPPLLTFDGGDVDPLAYQASVITRKDAMQLPGVAKSHHVLVSWASGLDLRLYPESEVQAMRKDPTHVPVPSDPQPSWLNDRTRDVSPEMRLWRLVDDLYFYGRALWLVERGRDGIRWADPVAVRNWEYDYDEDTEKETVRLGNVGMPLPAKNYVLFKVPFWDGILAEATRTLIGARATERAWVNRMLSPAQIVNFQLSQDAPFDQEELDSWLNSWRARRADGGQAVGATPYGLTMEVHPGSLGEADLFLSARNVNRNDIASHSSLDGSVADGSGGQDSLTYQTQVGIRDGFYETDSAFWLTQILAPLSQDSVTPPETLVLPAYRPVLAPTATGVAPVGQEITKSTSTSTTETPQQNRSRK